MIWYMLTAVMFLSFGMACAGELSDSVFPGKGRNARAFTGTASIETLKDRVGMIDEAVACWTSGDRAGDAFQITLNKQPGKEFALQIQEAYPPESPGVRYIYEVYVNDKKAYIRDYPGFMFGRVSYFVHVDDPDLLDDEQIILRFVNLHDGSPFRISAVWLYSDFEEYCRNARFDTPFYLVPLMKGAPDNPELEDQYRYVRANIKPAPEGDVRIGSAQEYHYMNRDASSTRRQFETLLRLARRYDMPLVLPFVSWWAGTPRWKPDGRGGVFSDPEYQQVCWSETDDYDEGDDLRELLGDRWDIRYGWTAPNQWSNTPWLTMNHPHLNRTRHKAIAEKLEILNEILNTPAFRGSADYLLALSMENEPRYWDLHCPDGQYPVKREDLWADFNPVTVADAARDGVDLDPSDGLSYEERLWLHRNVARYQQETYDAHADALQSLNIPFANKKTDVLWNEVYSHSFPSVKFPMESYPYRPLLEWNRLSGCKNGIEYDFRDSVDPVAWAEVSREWGRWSQVNYESNNGIGVDRHLRALRVCYAYGARFYVFYNWQSIDHDGRWVRYVQEFCEDERRNVVLQSGDSADSYKQNVRYGFHAELPTDWATFNELSVTLDSPGEYVLEVFDSPEKDTLLGYRRKSISEAGEASFDLPSSVRIVTHRHPYFEVHRADGESFGMLIDGNGQQVFSVVFDAQRERRQSLLINWRADAEEEIARLRSKRTPGIRNAARLFESGDYRMAYEEAIRIQNSPENMR